MVRSSRIITITATFVVDEQGNKKRALKQTALFWGKTDVEVR